MEPTVTAARVKSTVDGEHTATGFVITTAGVGFTVILIKAEPVIPFPSVAVKVYGVGPPGVPEVKVGLTITLELKLAEGLQAKITVGSPPETEPPNTSGEPLHTKAVAPLEIVADGLAPVIPVKAVV